MAIFDLHHHHYGFLELLAEWRSFELVGNV